MDSRVEPWNLLFAHNFKFSVKFCGIIVNCAKMVIGPIKTEPVRPESSNILAVCCVLFTCFWLSVPAQSIAWKDLSPK